MQRQMKIGVLEVHFCAPPTSFEMGKDHPPVVHFEVGGGEVGVQLPGIDDQTFFHFDVLSLGLGGLQIVVCGCWKRFLQQTLGCGGLMNGLLCLWRCVQLVHLGYDKPWNEVTSFSQFDLFDCPNGEVLCHQLHGIFQLHCTLVLLSCGQVGRDG